MQEKHTCDLVLFIYLKKTKTKNTKEKIQSVASQRRLCRVPTWLLLFRLTQAASDSHIKTKTWAPGQLTRAVEPVGRSPQHLAPSGHLFLQLEHQLTTSSCFHKRVSLHQSQIREQVYRHAFTQRTPSNKHLQQSISCDC